MIWWRLDLLILLGSYALIIGFFLIGRVMAKRKTENLLKEADVSVLKKLTVIIPFRNEADNLPQLLASIFELNELPLEILFVNDHSSDGSVDILKNAMDELCFGILHLDQEFGKKAALQHGIQQAKGEYILTWDADILVPETFFQQLSTYTWRDMMILPVEMTGSTRQEGFFTWEYQLQTQAALSISGWGRPLTASGANLLFRKSAYAEAETKRNDQQIASGDDMFLLSAFRKMGKEIQVVHDLLLKVTTKAPRDIASGMAQRKRWLKKSTKVKDNFATIFGLLALVVQLLYYGFVFFQLFSGFVFFPFLLILLKGELDALLCTVRFQGQFSTLQIFVYEWLYILYILVLVMTLPFSTLRWKDRTIL